jgi:hypothetical protein
MLPPSFPEPPQGSWFARHFVQSPGTPSAGCAGWPAGGARPQAVCRAVWTRWTGRGGGNQQRPVEAARRPPPPVRKLATRAPGEGASSRASCDPSSRTAAICSAKRPCVPAALSSKSATMEAQAQGEWSPIAPGIRSWDAHKGAFPALSNFALYKRVGAILRVRNSGPTRAFAIMLSKLRICCGHGDE